MSNRKLAKGALASFLFSLAIYAALGAALSWLYRDFALRDPMAAGHPLPALMKSFWFALSPAVPFLCSWWLGVFLAGRHHEARAHRLVAPADLWLLLSALVWALWVYAVLTRRFPVAAFACDRPGGFMATCVGPRRLYYWGGIALALGLFAFGLRRRMQGVGKSVTVTVFRKA